MSLTPHEIQLIQTSFQNVVPIKTQAADIFYNKLFEYDPGLRSLFKTNMEEQGNKLMSILGAAVKGLNDIEKLIPVLENLARTHLEYGVKIDDYTPVGNALIYALKQGLGEDFTPEVREAWSKLYRVLADVMRSAAYPEYDAGTYHNQKQYAARS